MDAERSAFHIENRRPAKASAVFSAPNFTSAGETRKNGIATLGRSVRVDEHQVLMIISALELEQILEQL